MGRKSSSMMCFSSITVDEPEIQKNTVKTKITLQKIQDESTTFSLVLHYKEPLKEEYRSLIRLACTMPLLNYGLFTKKILLNFPLNISDLNLVKELNQIFSRDIFVNKILRRRTRYIIPEYLPNEEKITVDDAQPKAVISPLEIVDDTSLSSNMNNQRCGILSSGGKESLLTYGLLSEIGCTVFPFYVNESGGHWRTAIPAYRYHQQSNPNTQRVWTNVDRFYVFMLDNLRFIRPDHRKVWGDTYPIRLCIFPFYVFLLLPLFVHNNIGNLLIGSEFDDLKSQPKYREISHYYGIYDQHQDYDEVMNTWYSKRISGLVQWSAVRNISGLIVERILVNRYPDLARYQRSCHSCHFERGNIIPCGKCSKCMGVLLFLLANNADPTQMAFRSEDVISFPKRVEHSHLKLDQDEKNQSFYLIGKKGTISYVESVDHVEKIHINKETCDLSLIPHHLRTQLMHIIEQYTSGYCMLDHNDWITIQKKECEVLRS